MVILHNSLAMRYPVRPMAYVRRKGNQLAVVHGVRDSKTRKVNQRTLFTLYSKAEALAAVGEEAHHFREILRSENPGLRFDWAKIEAAVRENLKHLPDLYGYKKERAERGFRSALCEFARELMLADPQRLISSARLLQANRHELAYLRDLIDWRLELCDQGESECNQDNPFYWRTISQRREVPPEEWEKLASHFERGEYEETEAFARLLIECWPNFAIGFNYLGLVEMERERFEAAVLHFDEAMRVGRMLFPKRIPKSMYWSDHDTRPYIRAMLYKAQALNRLERYDDALAICDRLEEECGQDISAALERVPILINSGQWKSAIAAARLVHHLYPDQNFPLAIAYFEAGDRHEALVHFLHALIKRPQAAKMLVGETGRTPATADAIEDHNTGVHLLRDLEPYLHRWPTKTKRFFKRVLESADVRALADAAQEARMNWRSNRSADRTWYQRMMEMESLEFARAHAADLSLLARSR